MSEYIKREDAVILLKGLNGYCIMQSGHPNEQIKVAIKTIKALPAEDAVDVVRCKDCSRWCICHKSDDYFCADGKRRSEWTTIPMGTGSAVTEKNGTSHAVSAGRRK